MKAAKQSKSDIEPVVAELLALKTKYESTVGVPFDAPKIKKESKVVSEIEGTVAKKSDSSKNKRSEVETKSNDAVDKLITPRTVDYSAW